MQCNKYLGKIPTQISSEATFHYFSIFQWKYSQYLPASLTVEFCDLLSKSFL